MILAGGHAFTVKGVHMIEPLSELPIEKIELVWGDVPVSVRFSYGIPETFCFCFVLITSSGQTGIGETLCHPTESVMKLARGLIGRNVLDGDDLVETLFEDHECVEKEAFSIALHDLSSKIESQPMCEHLGPVSRKSVPLMPCLFPNEPADARLLAEKYVGLGYRHLKTKLLGKLEHDVEVVRLIRQVADDGIYLQGDANCGYKNLDAALEALPKLKEAGLDVIEDAVEVGVQELAMLRSDKHPALMADISARSMKDVLELCRAHAVDYINLHPCQQGTLSEAMARARVACEYGIKVVVGGTGFCGGGSAAFQHLAGVIGLDGPCGELGGPFDHGMPQGLMKKQLIVKNGHVQLSSEPGHGAEPDWERLEKYTLGRIIIE